MELMFLIAGGIILAVLVLFLLYHIATVLEYLAIAFYLVLSNLKLIIFFGICLVVLFYILPLILERIFSAIWKLKFFHSKCIKILFFSIFPFLMFLSFWDDVKENHSLENIELNSATKKDNIENKYTAYDDLYYYGIDYYGDLKFFIRKKIYHTLNRNNFENFSKILQDFECKGSIDNDWNLIDVSCFSGNAELDEEIEFKLLAIRLPEPKNMDIKKETVSFRLSRDELFFN